MKPLTKIVGIGLIGLSSLLGCSEKGNIAGNSEAANSKKTELSGTIIDENYQNGHGNDDSTYSFVIKTEDNKRKVIEIMDGRTYTQEVYNKESVDTLLNIGDKVKINLNKFSRESAEQNGFSFIAGTFLRYLEIESAEKDKLILNR